MAREAAATGASYAPRRLRSDVFLMFASKIGVLVLNMAGTVIIARALGPSGRGIFAVAFNLTLIMVQIGSVGLISANPYFAARDSTTLGRIVANSLWVAASLGSVLFAAGLGLKLWFPDAVAGLGWTELAIALAGIPAALASGFLQSVLLGEGRTVAYNLVELALGAVIVAALAVGFGVFDMGIVPALAIASIGYVIAAGIYLVLLLRHRPRLARPDLSLARRMLGYAFRVYVATLLSFLVIRVDILLVNSYLGASDAGVYSVAAALAQGMYLFPTVVGVNLFPRIARGAGPEMSAEVFRSVAVLYGIVCLVTIPLAGPAIHLLYGPGFGAAVDLYYWLVPGIFSLGMLTILSHHFAGRGFPLAAMLVWFVGLGVNIAINVAFLADHGAYIASLASSVAYTLLLALHIRLFAREVGGYAALRPRPSEVVRFVRVALGRT